MKPTKTRRKILNGNPACKTAYGSPTIPPPMMTLIRFKAPALVVK